MVILLAGAGKAAGDAVVANLGDAMAAKDAQIEDLAKQLEEEKSAHAKAIADDKATHDAMVTEKDDELAKLKAELQSVQDELKERMEAAQMARLAAVACAAYITNVQASERPLMTPPTGREPENMQQKPPGRRWHLGSLERAPCFQAGPGHPTH